MYALPEMVVGASGMTHGLACTTTPTQNHPWGYMAPLSPSDVQFVVPGGAGNGTRFWWGHGEACTVLGTGDGHGLGWYERYKRHTVEYGEDAYTEWEVPRVA
jgi:hypothetical protein